MGPTPRSWHSPCLRVAGVALEDSLEFVGREWPTQGRSRMLFRALKEGSPSALAKPVAMLREISVVQAPGVEAPTDHLGGRGVCCGRGGC